MSAKTGQQPTTATAAALPAVSFTAGPVTVKALKANAAAVAIGAAGVTLATGYQLDPGESVSLPLTALQNLFIVGANTSDKVTWIGF